MKNGLKNICFVLFGMILSSGLMAQNISINADGAVPDSSAMLDVSDTTRGFLAPRMNTTQMNNISGPANGLLIYNIDSLGYMYYNGSTWLNITSGLGSGSTAVDTEWTEYTPTFMGLGTVSEIKVFYRREGPDLLLRGKFREGIGTAVFATMSLPTGLSVLSTVDSIELAGTVAFGGGVHNGHHSVLIQPDSTHIAFGHSTNTSGGLAKETGAILYGSNNVQSLFARVPIEGWGATSGGSISASSVDSASESGIVLLRDVKASGTAGGGSAAASWQTRDLNTKEGDTSFVSLTSNEFTLSAGVYLIEATAPAFRVALHRSRIYNVTDASEEIRGQNQFSPSSASANQTNATLQGIIDISSTKTFRLEHRTQTLQNTNGLGPAHSIVGESEIYSEVKIIKLDKVFGSGTSSSSSSSTDTLDENHFSARISSVGGITSENQNFISNVNNSATGTYDVTFVAGLFTVAPKVSGSVEEGTVSVPRILTVRNVSTTGCTIYIHNEIDGANEVSSDFGLDVSRQGSDYKYNTSGASASALASSDTSALIGDADNNTIIHTELNANDDTIRFFNAGVQTMTLTPGGNLGIGISSPNAPLQFPATTANRKLVLYEGVNNDHQFYGFGVQANELRYHTDATISDHVFYGAVNSTTSNELMRIQGDGSVGIGTSSPAINYPLTMNPLNNVHGGYIMFRDTFATQSWHIRAQGTNMQDLGFTESGVSDHRLVLQAGGNVGIGTASPTGQLHVFGTASIFENSGNNRQITIDGNGEIEANSGQTLYLNRVSASNVIINNGGGNVGVGAAPDSLFDVAGGAEIDRLNINSVYTFPSVDGSNGEVLTTNGGGTVSWQSANNIYGSNGSLTGDRTVTQGIRSISFNSAISSGTGITIENNVSGISGNPLTVNSSGTRSIGNSGLIVNNVVTKVGGSNSTKVGLEVNSTGSWGPATVNQPNVGILVTASGADNNYALRLVDGSQAANRVLTSDASGNASWQTKNTIYDNDATLSSDRVVTLGASNLDFNLNSTGDMRIQSNGNTNMLFIDANANAVGIGTASPNQELDVEGDIEIDGDYTYESARTQYTTVSHAAFVIAAGNVNVHAHRSISGTTALLVRTQGGTATSDAYLVAPLDLPDGAIVTDFAVRFFDSDGTYNCSAHLNRQLYTSTSTSSMASVTTSGTPGQITLNTTTITNATIDKSTYAYYIFFNTKEANTLLGLYNVRITYTTTRAD